MFRSLKGMEDTLPADIGRWQAMESKLRFILTSFGYQEIRTPILEETDLFTRSIGKETDVVGKEMFSFADQGGTQMSLRPELTAPVIRAYLEHHLGHGNDLVKVYYLGPLFRHERPQKGRLRQFHQMGVEAIGSAHPYVDVDVIAVMMASLEAFGVKDTELFINSVGDERCRPSYREKLQAYLRKHTGKLCENCRRRTQTNPMRVFDCKVESCQTSIQEAPKMMDHLCEECKTHFVRVQEGLKEAGIRASINPRIVRGFDYYTRTAFEVTAKGLGAQNAIAAGGRYDGLVEELGGPPTPSVGFAMGIERLLLSATADLSTQAMKRFEFLPLELKAESVALRWAKEFQRRLIEKRIAATVDVAYGITSLKSALRRADKNQTAFAILIGENELKANKALVKDLAAHQQEEIPFTDLAERLEQKAQ